MNAFVRYLLILLTGFAIAIPVTANAGSDTPVDHQITRPICKKADGPNWPCYKERKRNSYFIDNHGVVHYINGIHFRLEQ